MARDPRYDILFEEVKIGPKVARNRFYPGFPRWLLPIAEKSNTTGIPKAIPTRSCHDRLGSALDRVCLAMRNSAP